MNLIILTAESRRRGEENFETQRHSDAEAQEVRQGGNASFKRPAWSPLPRRNRIRRDVMCGGEGTKPALCEAFLFRGLKPTATGIASLRD